MYGEVRFRTGSDHGAVEAIFAVARIPSQNLSH